MKQKIRHQRGSFQKSIREAEEKLSNQTMVWLFGACLVGFVVNGVPEHIRSDNGPGMVAEELHSWLEHMGSKTAYIMPGSPWENDYCESFNGRMRDELLNGEIFYTLKEAQVVIEHWRNHYNTKRSHNALGYRPPAPEVVLPKEGIRESIGGIKALFHEIHAN
jgi:hypothetical protein